MIPCCISFFFFFFVHKRKKYRFDVTIYCYKHSPGSAKLQYLSGQEYKPPKCHAWNQCNSHLASTPKLIFLMYCVYGSTRTVSSTRHALTANSILALQSRIKSAMLKFENSFIESTCFTIFRTSSYMSIRLTQQQVLLLLQQHSMQKPMRLFFPACLSPHSA